ncbi:MAG: hypothetical protein K0S32_2120 [Bacteroidetes bacterium]|jgi:hypothetical protein|nr:hypothetical protein [Bacteroidota bacterium]
MKLLLEVPDNKAESLLEVLKSISFVKTKKLTDSKAKILSEIREAVEEMKLVKAKKKKSKNAIDFINEL